MRKGLDAVEVNADLLVRVSDGDVESHGVEESVVAGGVVIEAGKGGIGDGEFELLG